MTNDEYATTLHGQIIQDIIQAIREIRPFMSSDDIEAIRGLLSENETATS